MAQLGPSRGTGIPTSVPADASYDAAEGGWVVCPVDDGGRRHGTFAVYREDGSVALEGEYVDGSREGRFRGYHPNGDVASEATYTRGRIEGVSVRYTSKRDGSVPLRNCCVPAGAEEMHLHYREGRVVKEVFVDAEGAIVRADGSRLPPLPASLPKFADFDAQTQRWVWSEERGEGVAVRHEFDLGGRPVEDLELERGRRRKSVRFGADGRVIEHREFDAQGALHGPYSREHVEGSPYLDPRFVGEQGHFQHGHPVGAWVVFGGDRAVLRTVLRGELPSDERLAELCGEALRVADAAKVRARARMAFDAGAVREGLWLSARLLALDPSDPTFAELLASTVVPLGPIQREAWRQRLRDTPVHAVHVGLDALVMGAEPDEALRAIASSVPEGDPAALQMVDAALVLRPDELRSHARRAMLRLESGDVEGALEDAARLGSGGEVAVERNLRVMAGALFPRVAFGPEREPPGAPNPELPEMTIEQPLFAVHRTLALYATRIGVARDRVLEILKMPAVPTWLPPEPVGLLPEGRVELRRCTATIRDEDEEDGSVETSEVEIDETMGLDTTRLRDLMVTLRADWDALGWLCWASGLHHVGLPSRIEPPPAFATVVNDAMFRAWRTYEQLRSRGRVARSRGAPSFEWEGIGIDDLPPSLATIAARQYLERRAALLWSLFPQNVSPFQSDLRKV